MQPKPTVSLFVFIDAFGWELAKRHPFLDDVLVTKAPLTTVFGYSSTCDPTILTGKLPREHGHFSFFYYNPAASPFAAMRYLALLPRFLTRRGRVRRMMSRAIARYYGFTGYFQIYNMPFAHLPLFDYSEKRDIYAPGGINSGASSFLDTLRARGIPFHCSDWRRGEEASIASLGQELEAGRIRLAYLYLASMDALLHDRGTRSPRVRDKLRFYEEQLRHLLYLARKRYQHVRLFVFSDHGMTDVEQECDLVHRIEQLPLVFGRDYVAVYDSTMARFWFLKESARELIPEALKSEPNGQILSRAQLAHWGCDFSDDRYGELFFLLRPGVLLNPSFMGETRLAAMHGYDPADPDSIAFFGSDQRLADTPRGLADLADFILRDAVAQPRDAPG